jgi:hypothetical protein
MSTQVYRLEIGEQLDLQSNTLKPKMAMIISEEQYRLITTFADMEKDENLDTTFIINKCRFKIYPVIEIIKPTTQA